MKTQLINSMVSFTLGTGATLVALASWLGTADLQEIKDSVSSYVTESEQHASALVDEYNVMVDQANAEIGDYKAALDKANSNISQLITKYEEMENQSSEDISGLQAQLEEMQARLDQQYETDMNEMIEKANVEINKANEEVAQAKVDVNSIIESSEVEAIMGAEKSELSTDGDKSVENISGIVGLQIDSVEDMGVQTLAKTYSHATNQQIQTYKFTYNDEKVLYAYFFEKNGVKKVAVSTGLEVEFNYPSNVGLAQYEEITLQYFIDNSLTLHQ